MSSYIDMTESCSGSGSESDSDSFEPNTVIQNSDRAPESNQCCIIISNDETRLVVHQNVVYVVILMPIFDVESGDDETLVAEIRSDLQVDTDSDSDGEFHACSSTTIKDDQLSDTDSNEEKYAS